MAEVATTPATPATTSAPAHAPAAPAQPVAASSAKGDAKAAPAAQTPASASAIAPGAKPAQGAGTPAPGADAAKQASQPADAKPEPAKPAAPEKDEVAETMARLNREQREMGDKVKLGEAMVAAREALGKKDFLGALTTLAGEAGLDPDEAAVLLLEQASSREKPPLTEEQARKVAEKAFEDKQKAAQEEAQKREEAEIAQGKQLYGNACAEIYKANAAQFPLISAYGLSDEEIFGWVIPEMKRQRGNPPLPQQTLEHFEKQHFSRFEKAAAKLGYVKAAPHPAAPAQQPGAKSATAAATPAIVPAADTGGNVSEPKKTRETIAEYNKRVREQFRARRQAAQ